MHKSTFLFTVEEKVISAAKDINLDSVFLSYPTAMDGGIEAVRKSLENLDAYVLVTVFAGKDLLKKYPDAKPVEASGKEIDMEGICPTHPNIREDAIKKVQKLIDAGVDGIWLDALRYPTKWEVPNPNLLDTCYCSRCVKLFEEYIGEPIDGVGGEGTELENLALHIDGSYYHEWLEFKSEQITSLVREIKKLIDDSAEDIMLGYYAVPWEDSQHRAAIKRLLGQDLVKLSGVVDVVSPMLYYKMSGKNVDWIKEMVKHFWGAGKPFLPYVQTEDKPDEILPGEFKKSLILASTRPSMGVCIFFLDDLLKDPPKLKIAKEFFAEN